MLFTQSLPTNAIINWSHCNVRKNKNKTRSSSSKEMQRVHAGSPRRTKVIGARKWPSVDLCENAAHRPNVDLWWTLQFSKRHKRHKVTKCKIVQIALWKLIKQNSHFVWQTFVLVAKVFHILHTFTSYRALSVAFWKNDLASWDQCDWSLKSECLPTFRLWVWVSCSGASTCFWFISLPSPWSSTCCRRAAQVEFSVSNLVTLLGWGFWNLLNSHIISQHLKIIQSSKSMQKLLLLLKPHSILRCSLVQMPGFGQVFSWHIVREKLHFGSMSNSLLSLFIPVVHLSLKSKVWRSIWAFQFVS